MPTHPSHSISTSETKKNKIVLYCFFKLDWLIFIMKNINVTKAITTKKGRYPKSSSGLKMLYKLMGGREAHMRNVMQNYNSDGDFIGPGGVVVPGMYHGEDGKVDRSTWQQLIPVSDDMRQKMFDNVKREFIQENGISNGDTTKRSQIFREYQLSVKKEDRAKGTWTLQQYEGKYRSAMYAAVKAANPKWEPGQPFDPSILDSVTRESVESTLVKSGNTFVKRSSVSGSSLDVQV